MKTAVEWLVEEANLLENNGWIITLINQAKEMEKEQIINVVEYYCADTGEAELYYKETFKSE